MITSDAPMPHVGDELMRRDGTRYLVLGWDSILRTFELCRIPSGMTALDLGRRFYHNPTATDYSAYAVKE